MEALITSKNEPNVILLQAETLNYSPITIQLVRLAKTFKFTTKN